MAFAGSLRNQGLAHRHDIKKIYTLHFTSKRKMMSVLIKDNVKKKNYLLIKGAAEKVIEKATHFLNGKGEEI